MATAGLVMLIAGFARLNAVDAGAQSPPGHADRRRCRRPSANTESTDDRTSPYGAVHALFDLQHPETGPFPSDIFTVADRTHNTRRRVNLPYPDCTVRPSDCEDLDVINTLDGFGLQTRISIPFDGAIDVNTATSETVFLIRLGSTLLVGLWPRTYLANRSWNWHQHLSTSDAAGHSARGTCLPDALALRHRSRNSASPKPRSRYTVTLFSTSTSPPRSVVARRRSRSPRIVATASN